MVLFVIDCNDGARLGMVKDEIWKHQNIQYFKTPFFFCKQTRSSQCNSKRCVDNTFGSLKIRGREWSVAESTATEGHGIEDGFDWLSKHL